MHVGQPGHGSLQYSLTTSSHYRHYRNVMFDAAAEWSVLIEQRGEGDGIVDVCLDDFLFRARNGQLDQPFDFFIFLLTFDHTAHNHVGTEATPAFVVASLILSSIRRRLQC